MSDNKKTVGVETGTQTEKKLTKKGMWTIVICSVALVAMIAGIIIAAVLSNRGFNYKKKDISKYITVPEELYKSYTVKVDIPEITAVDVEEEIIKILCAKKKIPDELPDSDDDVTISAGDIAYIYFRGYTEENGVKDYFNGGCNFAGKYSALEIGKGSFIPGFESGLVGKNQQNYATLNRRISGTVEADDLVSITYSVLRFDHTTATSQTVTLDLSDPDLDKTWGEGFKSFLVGRTIDPDTVLDLGEEMIFPITYNGETGDNTYFDITIHSACKVNDSEKPILEVEARFPRDYTAADLRNKTAKFEVYILGVDDYEVPEFDDAFITDTLGIKAEDMAHFEGATLADKYRTYIKQALNDQRDSEIRTAIEDTFWEQIVAGSEVKEFPKNEVEKMYDSMLSQLVQAYESESSSNTSYAATDIDSYIRTQLQISSSADWKVHLRQKAEAAVKEKLIFYYILQVENLYPSEERYNELYEMIFNTHLQEYLDYYGITEGTANYERELANAKKEVNKAYGSAYFEETVLYEHVMNELATRAKVVVEI